MAVTSKNKYLQSILDNLIAAHEIEINYLPIEIELDKQKINAEDIKSLLKFVNEPRKRLFIFKIDGDDVSSNLLANSARRSVLNNFAEVILKSTSSEPKINPLKHALGDTTATVRAGIQIQKSFILPKKPIIDDDEQTELKLSVIAPHLELLDINIPQLPELVRQLKGLGIDSLQDSADEKIREHLHVFTDGVILSNLPEGFYINKNKRALCYTQTPNRLPSGLAPKLEKPTPITLPSLEQAKAILPESMEEKIIEHLLNNAQPDTQKKALLNVLNSYSKELVAVLQLLKPAEVEFIVPMLAKYFILGGETHTTLFIRLLKNCINKKVSIDFLKDPTAQDAFLSPRGIKNLQKLLELPAEQKEWWNKLTIAHVKNDLHCFDFNTFFEAYTQIFIPRITEKNLTLPNPCPVDHNGHLLITLNRVLEVIEYAGNPQEQCVTLANLNWGPTGSHYAMVNAPQAERLKHVASCMKLATIEDTKTLPDSIYLQLETPGFSLEPWLFRYMGQNWKKEIRLTEIQTQLGILQNLPNWTLAQKNRLTFILTCTFSDKLPLTAAQWTASISKSINLLQSLNEEDRTSLLQVFSRCFQFKPIPSLDQINRLIEQCLELKTAFPNKHFKDEIITPLGSCLENEGFELFNTVQERIQKTAPEPNDRPYTLTALSSFTMLLQANRSKLKPEIIKLLAKLNEPELSQENIDNLIQSIVILKENKGEEYCNLLLSTISQINITKSQTLPNSQQIQDLIKAISDSAPPIPIEHKTIEKQEGWLKDYILEKNLLPGCVLGNGDISKLDDLLVDALVDAVKKRSAVLKIDKLKASLEQDLQSKLVPEQLKQQLDQDLMPLLDAFNDLIVLLLSPNPKFDDVLKSLAFFEEKKPILLNGDYSLSILGNSKGKFLLSFILSGKRREDDDITGAMFSTLLGKLHGLIVDEIHAFFNAEHTKLLVKDLDAKTTLSWLSSFNDTHSLTFFFKEELVHKKVLPALKKTLLQLHTQDSEFENSILAAAAEIEENKPSNESLRNYKNKIESIASYLNLLIDIKDNEPGHFKTIYKQLQTGPLSRLNYSQKQILINKLLKANPASLTIYLQLTTQALEENLEANDAAIERAISGLITLFNIPDLEPETQIMFFKMSLAHNLKSSSPFPLADLNELKQSALPEETKSGIIKSIIQLLSHMTDANSPDLIRALVQQTQTFLTQNPGQASLCIALLKRVSLENISRDLTAYPNILQQLSALNSEHRGKLTTVLTGIASSKKDDSVNLPTLLDITKGLGRRSAVDLDTVVALFATPPYPLAQTLNSALLVHGSEKLQAYSLNFDTNPFTKPGETRALEKQFETDRIKDALLSLKDLMLGVDLPHSLQLQLARQLTYIETLGYTDPLKPNDYTHLQKLTAYSRHNLKERACYLLGQLRSNAIAPEKLELTQLELLAYLREIYFRTTGLFPNTTQILMLLLSLDSSAANLLMSIKTGEGKSLITPMLAVLQWAQGGTVDMCTANRTLLGRDYENNCELFFKFLGIESSLIQSNSRASEYKLNGINCSTLEDMALFRLAAKESHQEAFVQNDNPIHVVLDECDDALLDQTTLYKLVAEIDSSEPNNENPAQWVYPLAYQFINRQLFRNTDPSKGEVWDEETDLEQFRIYLNKQINEQFNGDAEKLNFVMKIGNTELRQWINASCKAATLVENKHFIVQTITEQDELSNERKHRMVCVPLQRSTPKTGCIFTTGIQQALHARLMAQRKELAHLFVIDADPPVLASQSARGLIQFYQNTHGRLLGISGTPGDALELQYLNTLFGTKAIGVDPYAGDKRIKHSPIFTFSRKESIYEIEKAINLIKKPVTIPSLNLNPDNPIQTIEEKEALAVQTNEVIDQWSQTQTQPILIICDDFEETQLYGARLNFYKDSGFKIQVVTGKESPEKLALIIKQAGRANTITIGTAMLARGIDINPRNHPEGLFVFQTYPDSERMTTQIGGRAARNGKPGQWLPIYQVKPPQNIFRKILYYIFPWYRQKENIKAVEQLQTEIKLQAEVDRLYTQAIDHVQRTLMQQIQAWESLLLEFYPADPKLQHELYQWRETLLSELTHVQEAGISKETLHLSISRFKNSVEKLWENAKEEKWAARADKTPNLTPDQSLRLNYLKHIDLVQEFNVQAKLQPKIFAFEEGTKSLMHQNLDSMIRDKAGAVIDYTNPSQSEKVSLHLAKAKQLIPSLIGELCLIYPQDIKQFNLNNNTQGSHYLPQVVNNLILKLVEHKNKALLRHEDRLQISKAIAQLYQDHLQEADTATIETLLEKIKKIILQHSASCDKTSLIEQFKMQGIILNFCTVYKNLGLPQEEELIQVQKGFDDHIMGKLADYLLSEFAWIKQSPQPIHARFERAVAKDAAREIHDLAEEVHNSPDNEEKIHALYRGLQKHRVILQNKYLFAIQHHSPRNVIHRALKAIESLQRAPHCDKSFQISSHDSAVSNYHVAKFKTCIEKTSAAFNDADPVWSYLTSKLLAIINKGGDKIHLISELYETIERFNGYGAYKPYLSQLQTMKSQLTDSIRELKKSNGLKQDHQLSLFAAKADELADLYQVNPESVRIQSGSDGIESYIEVQVENSSLKEGFTGYQSPSLSTIEKERDRITRYREHLAANEQVLENLTDSNICATLSAENRTEFELLFKLKALLSDDWSKGLDNAAITPLPNQTKTSLTNIQRLLQLDLFSKPADSTQIGLNIDDEFKAVIEEQHKLFAGIDQINEEITQLTQEIGKIRKSISEKEGQIEQNNKQQPVATFIHKLYLKGVNYSTNSGIESLQKEISSLNETIDSLEQGKRSYQEQLNPVNEELGRKRNEFVAGLILQAKSALSQHVHDKSKERVKIIQKELKATEATFVLLNKEESKKSRYQTRRFFSSSELLKYEASLRKEEKLIPEKQGKELVVAHEGALEMSFS